MCGIAACFGYRDDAPPVDRDELQRITDQMFRRGPDAGGTWVDGRIGLGARRLAIIDLTPEGTQPMWDVERELVIAYNGEIYNHRELRARLEAGGARFHSTTDTEVLLQLFRRDGERMVDLLRGMYALAIWDSRARRLFVARDPYGIKPLYFADDGKTFRAASQVKALLAGGAVPRTRDAAGMTGFFLTGSVPEPFTTWQSIRAVEAGTSFFVDANGRGPERRHYSIAAALRRGHEQRSIARLVTPEQMLRERVTESIDYHLVSDVPVGAFLSAGIDSTTLLALATQRTSEPLRTVTTTFEEFRGGHDDEAPLAERFAGERGARHTTRLVTRAEFLDDLPRIFAAMDQPTIDGVNTWFASKAAAELGLKVALSGIGGDELFGSYPAFREVPRIVSLARLPFGSRVARLASRSPKSRAIADFGASWAGAYFVKRGLFMPDELPAVMGRDDAEEGLGRLNLIGRMREKLEPDPRTSFGRVAVLEAAQYMRNQLLRDTDWASMAHSLEVRTPLVDAALLRQLAPLLLEYGSRCKQAFAAAPSHPLPKWLAHRRKTGFLTPLPQWLGLPPDGTSTRMRSWARMVYEAA
ncbi:MAG TPA: asparagine synthase (glutamine-hydrolyzing) [Thermoanaerobaculia bacterium]|nr:asparagine synthase (glutamine-hydrolyzing) [Thermoanaerobaculia bacterium]